MPVPDTVVVALSSNFPLEYESVLREVSPRLQLERLAPGAAQSAQTRSRASEAEVLAWWQFSRGDLAALAPRMPRLRWVQSPAAGVGDQRLHEILGPNVTIASAAGVYAGLVAEHALMLLLALNRRLPDLLLQQQQERWAMLDTRFVDGQTMGIVGAGGIGQAAARMAKAFGMRTMGIRRGVEPIPDVDLTLRQDQLPLLLAESDAVLLATPLTPETTGLVDSAFLHSMKRTAVLINVARGKVVNTGALITALNEQVIAGAGLDVTDPEPLPAGHPLWHARNAIITPHHANPYRSSGMYPVRRFAENLRRYLAGESLLAIVDPERGY